MGGKEINMPMLEKWAEKLEERDLLDYFLDWLVAHGHQPPWFHSGREAALDAFFEIDRLQLDRERRELLAQVRGEA